MIKMIVALGPNNLIGKGLKLPWSNLEELQFFKKTTWGHACLWGRKTFVNLPTKLKGRYHYVISSQKTIENADQVLNNQDQILELLKKFQNSSQTLFICGGKSVYEKYYHYAQIIFVSKVDTQVKGDVYLELDLSQYDQEIYYIGDKFKVYKYSQKTR